MGWVGARARARGMARARARARARDRARDRARARARARPRGGPGLSEAVGPAREHLRPNLPLGMGLRLESLFLNVIGLGLGSVFGLWITLALLPER